MASTKSSRPSSRNSSSERSNAKSLPAPVSSTLVWRYDAESANNLTKNDFNAELSKEIKSKGSFENDYTFYCNSYGLVPCPFIKTRPSSIEQMIIVYIEYCNIDEASFRAALLAISCVGSRVCEIHIHGCNLSPSNLVDLAAVLAKLAFINVFRLEFLQLDDKYSINEYADAFKQLVSSDFGAEYLSFRQSRLGDAIISSIATALTQNNAIKSLNVSGCNISNNSFIELMNAMYTNLYLDSISVANNNLSGAIVIEKVIDIVRGKPASSEEIAAVKTALKKSNDRLRRIKDINRKRKKSSLVEFNEVELTAGDRILKGSDSQQIISNRLLNFLDLSGNQIDCVSIVNAADKLSTLASLINISSTYQMNIRVTGIEDVDIPSTFFKFSAV